MVITMKKSLTKLLARMILFMFGGAGALMRD
jgi:hypothetical protein